MVRYSTSQPCNQADQFDMVCDTALSITVMNDSTGRLAVLCMQWYYYSPVCVHTPQVVNACAPLLLQAGRLEHTNADTQIQHCGPLGMHAYKNSMHLAVHATLSQDPNIDISASTLQIHRRQGASADTFTPGNQTEANLWLGVWRRAQPSLQEGVTSDQQIERPESLLQDA
jgi:hypothetical protein